MFANPTEYKARLTVAPQPTLVGRSHPSIFPLPGEVEFPSPKCMPNAVLQLDLWLSAFVADLQHITNIIRSDIGLTAQLLRLAAGTNGVSTGRIVAISDIVVDIGVEKLRALVAGTRTLPNRIGSQEGSTACDRFWAHSRLTALIAEELACQSFEVNPEEAYLSGLLCQVGELPSLLHWDTTYSNTEDSRDLGRQIAKAWGFPRDVVDVIGADREMCRTRESLTLLDIVTDASVWASRLECLAERESEAVRAEIPSDKKRTRLEIPI
jgi:HD-like signal output (HDOD) protein